jgi:hypothetical protein
MLSRTDLRCCFIPTIVMRRTDHQRVYGCSLVSTQRELLRESGRKTDKIGIPSNKRRVALVHIQCIELSRLIPELGALN